MSESKAPSRLHVIDALRGFAIVSIMLLHNIEHFDFFYRPEGLPAWMVNLDKGIWDTLFFLFGGKSYGIFALLFGLTFFIQSDNQERRGNDFRGRFAWRLVLLFGFGIVNSCFYQGDILTLYAVVGFLIIPFARLNNKIVFAVALLLLAQPFFIVKLIDALMHPDMLIANPKSWAYFGKSTEYLSEGDFFATVWGNLTNGKTAVVLWSWENGRYFHILALFLLGMLMGRKQLFAENAETKRFWIKTLFIAAASFTVLYLIQIHAPSHLPGKAAKRYFATIENSWTSIAFMFVLIAGFVLAFRSRIGKRILGILSPIGKMSLSNYIFQSILGASIYHGYGLGLFKHTGSTYCLLIGLLLAVGLGLFCHWWTKRHKHGPLEGIWHKLTWISIR